MNEMIEISRVMQALARYIQRHRGIFSERELAVLTTKFNWCAEHWPKPGQQTELKLVAKKKRQ